MEGFFLKKIVLFYPQFTCIFLSTFMVLPSPLSPLAKAVIPKPPAGSLAFPSPLNHLSGPQTRLSYLPDNEGYKHL